MSNENSEAATPETFGDERDEIVDRCKKSKIQFEISNFAIFSDREEVRRRLVIKLANGRQQREFNISPPFANLLLSSTFEEWTILGDYVAYLDKANDKIEALLRPPGRLFASSKLYMSLPGVNVVEVAQNSDDVVDSDGYDDFIEPPRKELDWTWSTVAGKSSVRLTLSPAGPVLSALASDGNDVRRITAPKLTIEGITTNRYEDALRILERYSSALLFELDLRYSIPLTLARMRPSLNETRGALRRQRSNETIEILENSYSEQAVSMYFYGRSANGMPLLQYLAYYQAIEFFFPSFANADALTRIRNLLRDPLFNKEDQSDIQKVASIAIGSQRGTSSEREQLRITISSCLQDFELHDYMNAAPLRMEFFAKSSALRDVSRIDFNPHNKVRLVDQVADRIYTLRCRIVHAKENGGPKEQKLLLPFGSEADSLRHDIMLLQFIAQKVIIAGSRGTL
ncbi:hypothetical protein P3102_08740 [Amycolatopsis sp. QT-25]|uniref:hypothetical protein n=1 Tax=Amycolatopsis sp. QT-25 TaxID=3034022 RepID=UPI0023EB75A3|nr:hypothetical protein [Amycolatopsis sp. QT-25]WET81292.1 hypothetical protein P3102_08740 [Amycolatopsis sp. QT-25]